MLAFAIEIGMQGALIHYCSQERKLVRPHRQVKYTAPSLKRAGKPCWLLMSADLLSFIADTEDKANSHAGQIRANGLGEKLGAIEEKRLPLLLYNRLPHVMA